MHRKYELEEILTKNVYITEMKKEHIDGVYETECESFSVPWGKKSFYDELNNNLAYYFVALDENSTVCGYCGLWHIVNEGHITNIAVKPHFRGCGIGKKLMAQIIELAYEKEMIGITLEVRMSNTKAQSLYAGFGFKPEGIRKKYYKETNEDAIVMWKYL